MIAARQLRFVLLAFILLILAPTPSRADAFGTASVYFSGFTISVSEGTIVFLEDDWYGEAEAAAANTLGEIDSDNASTLGGTTPLVKASVTWGDGAAMTSASGL